MLTMMGLDPRFWVFSLLGLPIVHFALSGVVFCLDFGPLFFLFLIPRWVFFFYYLFIFVINLMMRHYGNTFKLNMFNYVFMLFIKDHCSS